MTDQGIEDIAVAQIDSANLIHGFHELYQIINKYIDNQSHKEEWRYISWVKKAGRFMSIEGFRALLREALGTWVF